VALQASAPDILLILLRYGGNPNGDEAGTSPILALMDKLIDCESGSYPYQLVSCLKLLILAVPFIELPFKVKD
jgi:ankyrin repeat and SOCS box protein 17